MKTRRVPGGRLKRKPRFSWNRIDRTKEPLKVIPAVADDRPGPFSGSIEAELGQVNLVLSQPPSVCGPRDNGPVRMNVQLNVVPSLCRIPDLGLELVGVLIEVMLAVGPHGTNVREESQRNAQALASIQEIGRRTEEGLVIRAVVAAVEYFVIYRH